MVFPAFRPDIFFIEVRGRLCLPLDPSSRPCFPQSECRLSVFKSFSVVLSSFPEHRLAWPSLVLLPRLFGGGLKFVFSSWDFLAFSLFPEASAIAFAAPLSSLPDASGVEPFARHSAALQFLGPFFGIFLGRPFFFPMIIGYCYFLSSGSSPAISSCKEG